MTIKKKILIAVPAVILLSVAAYAVYWAVFFFPDDFNLAQSEASIDPPADTSRVLQLALVDQIDAAELRGDFAVKSVVKRVEALKAKNFLVKNDDFIRGVRRNLVFRAGTGMPGIWVDERSSIILPPMGSAGFSFIVKPGGRVEFSALSLGGAGALELDIESAGVKTVKETYPLDAYQCALKGSDVAPRRDNRGYPRAHDDIGWKEYSADLAKWEGKQVTLRFSYTSKDGTAFIGNPKVFAAAESSRRYNVIYLIFDGVSTRQWSFYNSDSQLTPFMREVAKKDFIVFDNMFSLGDKTRISTTGLFCSEYPFATRHGINRNFIPEREINQFYNMVQSGQIATMPDQFRRNGYETAQFGDSGFTVQLITTGIDYGFDRSYEFSYNPYNAYGISHQFFDFLRKNNNREFFAYIHYNTTHKPFYAPIQHYLKGVVNAPIEALWRPDFMATVSYSDDVFRSVYETIKKNNLLDNTIIVVACDHGATFDLSKFAAGFQYNDFTRMTFMIHLPPELRKKLGSSRERIETYLSSINSAPTLSEMAGIPVAKAFRGKSFAPLLSDSSDVNFFGKDIWSFGRKEMSVITDDLKKYIICFNEDQRYVKKDYVIFGEGREVPFEQIFDLKDDPNESKNLVSSRPDLLKKFRDLVLEKDPHHPERNVITFIPSDNQKHRIEIEVRSPSPLSQAGIYDGNLKELPGLTGRKAGSLTQLSFDVEKNPVYLVIECENDRAPLTIMTNVDGKRLQRENIFATDLNLNMFDNPISMQSRNDFLILNDIRLPSPDEILKFKRPGVSMKIVRLDLHRWIDLGKLEQSGISAGMKETLKSWGYIQ